MCVVVGMGDQMVVRSVFSNTFGHSPALAAVIQSNNRTSSTVKGLYSRTFSLGGGGGG